MTEREIALNMLLRPLKTGDGKQAIGPRQGITIRLQQIAGAYPFLTADERALADAWIRDGEAILAGMRALVEAADGR